MAKADLLSLNSSQVLSKIVIELKCLQLLPGVDIGNKDFFVVVVITAFYKEPNISERFDEATYFEIEPHVQTTT